MDSRVRSTPPLLQIGFFLIALLLLPWMARQPGGVGVVAYLLAGAVGVWVVAWSSGPEDHLCIGQWKPLIVVGWPVFAALKVYRALLEFIGQKPSAALPLAVPVAEPAVAPPVAKAPPPVPVVSAPAPVAPPVAKAPPPAPVVSTPAPVVPPVAKAPPPVPVVPAGGGPRPRGGKSKSRHK